MLSNSIRWRLHLWQASWSLPCLGRCSRQSFAWQIAVGSNDLTRNSNPVQQLPAKATFSASELPCAGVKSLLAGQQQAAVTVAVEGLMDAKAGPDSDAFLTFDPKVCMYKSLLLGTC